MGPGREPVPEKPYLVLQSGDVEAVVANNEPVDDELLPGHGRGFSGVASLKHARRRENLFVPRYAGLNFELIHDGTDQTQEILLEPRHAPMEIRRLDEDAVELHQAPTPHWKLESRLQYEILDDGAIELRMECVPHERVFKNDYIGLFFASYIHQPESPDIHFLGHETGAGGAQPRWIRSIAPDGWQGWNTGTGYPGDYLKTHRSVEDRRQFPHDPDCRLTTIFTFSKYRYSEPWYYGVSHGLALVHIFRNQDRVWFSQVPSGGGKGNPAWDFQWFIPNYEVGRHYRFVMRMMYLPFESPEQMVKATAAHRAALNAK